MAQLRQYDQVRLQEADRRLQCGTANGAAVYFHPACGYYSVFAAHVSSLVAVPLLGVPRRMVLLFYIYIYILVIFRGLHRVHTRTMYRYARCTDMLRKCAKAACQMSS